MRTQELVFTGHVPPGREKFYLDVPFEMPPGVARLDVRYQYTDRISSDPHLTGGNTVDIGLFDARGYEFPAAGFRGWSGSERLDLFITPTEATRGYLYGPLMPGTWAVSLGFYKVGPRGCDYKIYVQFTFGDDSVLDFPPRLTVDSPQPTHPMSADGWYRGELHCHSTHSDGDSTPAQIIAAAETLDLDFLALMDHNNITHTVELERLTTPNLVLIPGYEVTTYRGHWNAWGADTWIDFRVLTPEMTAQVIAFANAHGALTSCNHPRPYGPSWEYEDVTGYRCVEVWNGPWRLQNTIALDFWERRLRQGQRLVAVGGSDMHRLHADNVVARLALPTTWIYTSEAPTARSLLTALRAGHAFISESPDGPRLDLRSDNTMMGDTRPRPADGLLPVQVRVQGGAGMALELHGPNGLLHREILSADNIQLSRTVPGANSLYVRAQLVDPVDDELIVHALTNPIYLVSSSWEDAIGSLNSI